MDGFVVRVLAARRRRPIRFLNEADTTLRSTVNVATSGETEQEARVFTCALLNINVTMMWPLRSDFAKFHPIGGYCVDVPRPRVGYPA